MRANLLGFSDKSLSRLEEYFLKKLLSGVAKRKERIFP
jgi:hypothetical protein